MEPFEEIKINKMDNTQEKQKYKYEGEVKYTITEDDSGNWDIVYESTIENEIAVLSIAQELTETIIGGLLLEKKCASTTKEKKHLQILIEKASAARFGTKMMIDYMLPLYMDFKAKLEKDGKKY